MSRLIYIAILLLQLFFLVKSPLYYNIGDSLPPDGLYVITNGFFIADESGDVGLSDMGYGISTKNIRLCDFDKEQWYNENTNSMSPMAVTIVGIVSGSAISVIDSCSCELPSAIAYNNCVLGDFVGAFDTAMLNLQNYVNKKADAGYSLPTSLSTIQSKFDAIDRWYDNDPEYYTGIRIAYLKALATFQEVAAKDQDASIYLGAIDDAVGQLRSWLRNDISVRWDSDGNRSKIYTSWSKLRASFER